MFPSARSGGSEVGVRAPLRTQGPTYKQEKRRCALAFVFLTAGGLLSLSIFLSEAEDWNLRDSFLSLCAVRCSVTNYGSTDGSSPSSWQALLGSDGLGSVRVGSFVDQWF